MTSVSSRGEVLIEVGGAKLSARFAPATGRTPRALVVALHGGGLRSPYFDAAPDLSLLDLGEQLGFSVLALDRPGYGPASGLSAEQLTLPGQSALVRVAIDRVRSEHAEGEGVFLVGHSFGSMLAIRIASERPAWLLGIEVSGAGVRYKRSTTESFQRRQPQGTHASDRRRVVSDTSWPLSRAAKDALAEARAPVPVPEALEARDWQQILRELAPRVRVPVRFTMPEHDEYWVVNDETMREAAKLFSSAPFVDAHLQRFADHVISLHAVARAYHLRTLAFCEECILHRLGPARV